MIEWCSATGRAMQQLDNQELFVLKKSLNRPSDGPGALKLVKIKGDGRCLFRALAQGMARHQGIHLSASIETQEADQLRGAVAEALCRTPARRREFRDALLSVQAEGYTLPGYCRQLMSPGFWGGEPELLVLSSMLKVPIVVYTPTEHGYAKRGSV